MDQTFVRNFRDKFKSRLANDLQTPLTLKSDFNSELSTSGEDRRLNRKSNWKSDFNLNQIRNHSRLKLDQFFSELASSTPFQDENLKTVEQKYEQEFDFFVGSSKKPSKWRTMNPMETRVTELSLADQLMKRNDQIKESKDEFLWFPPSQEARKSFISTEDQEQRSHLDFGRLVLQKKLNSTDEFSEEEEEDILILPKLSSWLSMTSELRMSKDELRQQLNLSKSEQQLIVLKSKSDQDQVRLNDESRLEELVIAYNQHDWTAEVNELSQQLNQLQKQINSLEVEIKTLLQEMEINKSSLSEDQFLIEQRALYHMQTLIQEALRLALKRQLMVIERRKTLLSILNSWKNITDYRSSNRVEERKSNESTHTEVNTSMTQLKFEEQMAGDELIERDQLNSLVEQHVQLELKMQRFASKQKTSLFKFFGKLGKTRSNEPPTEDQLRIMIQAQTFLLDGRLPGEPIFSNICIEKFLPEKEQVNSSQSSLIDDKSLATKTSKTNKQELVEQTENAHFFVGQSNKLLLDQRQQTLQQRATKQIESQQVPLYERELSLVNLLHTPSTLNEEDVSQLESNLSKRSFNESTDKSINPLQQWIQNRLLAKQKRFQMLTELGDSGRNMHRYHRYEDLVNEPNESIQSTFNFNRIFATRFGRRPLQAVRKSNTDRPNSWSTGAQHVPPPLAANQEQWIQIRIRQALNVPMRNSSTAAWPFAVQSQTNLINSNNRFTQSSITTAIDLLQVRPFVELSFRRSNIRTRSGYGTTPAWNESLAFSLARQHLRPDEQLLISLFDQLDEKHSQQRQWLGSVRLSLLSLLTSGRIEGNFQLETSPLQLFHFQQPPQQQLINLATGGPQRPLLNSQLEMNQLTATFPCTISVVIRLDPRSPPPPSPPLPSCDSLEAPLLIDYARRWQQQLREKFPERCFRFLSVALPQQKWSLCCRFLSPVRPPDLLLRDLQVSSNQLEMLLSKIARFVSLIPQQVDAHQLAWATGDQILQLNLASEQERALLLCCYFLYLGKHVAVALGEDCSAGNAAAFVLVWPDPRQKSQWSVTNDISGSNASNVHPQLWHPNSGQCFAIEHSRQLPAVSLHTMITSQNVYANVQKSDHPLQMRYDLDQANDWRPLLANSGKSATIANADTAAVTGISHKNILQPSTISYPPPNERNILALESQLELQLREQLMSWRKQQRTFFNRELCRRAKQWLSLLEPAYFNNVFTTTNIGTSNPSGLLLQTSSAPISLRSGSPAPSNRNSLEEAKENWRQTLAPYQVRDFLHHQSMDRLNLIADALFASGLHRNQHRHLDFVLSVHLHAYTEQVISVWIYFASLVRLDELDT